MDSICNRTAKNGALDKTRRSVAASRHGGPRGQRPGPAELFGYGHGCQAPPRVSHQRIRAGSTRRRTGTASPDPKLQPPRPRIPQDEWSGQEEPAELLLELLEAPRGVRKDRRVHTCGERVTGGLL